MKSKEEISIEKERLKKLRSVLPEFNIFGDSNHAIIDAQLDVLDVLDFNISDEEEAIDLVDTIGEDGVDRVSEALDWLYGTRAESLVEDDDIYPKIKKPLLKQKKQGIEAFRIRWRRWLGQKCRCDQPHYMTLLDSSWTAWANTVKKNHGAEFTYLHFTTDRNTIYNHFLDAINLATIEELGKLDCLYCDDLLHKQEKKRK